MGKGNEKRGKKGIEVAPDGAISADELKKVMERQDQPPADLPVAKNREQQSTGPTIETALRRPVATEEKEWLEGEYIELIEDYYKKLFFEEDNLKKVLKENGLKPLAPWTKKTQELLEADEIARGCLEYTSEILSKKYKDRVEELEKAILENQLGQIPEIKSETTKAILTYYEDALETFKKRTKSEKNRGIIEAEIEKARSLLSKDSPAPVAKLEIDKSGENEEQKKLREKIEKEDIPKAIDFAWGEIESEIKRIKEKAGALANRGIDETQLLKDWKAIKERILEEKSDVFAGSIMGYLGKDYKGPYADQIIRTEARRMVAVEFGKSKELAKVMPKGRYSRDFEEKAAPIPSARETILEEPKEKPLTLKNILLNPELEKIYEAIRNVAVEKFKKLQEESRGWTGLKNKEKKNIMELMLKGALRTQYEKRFIPAGSPGKEEIKEFFVDSILKFVESEIKKG